MIYNESMKIKKCFSLIELLVAVAIIAILAGVGLVYMGRSKEMARFVRAKKELETIAGSLESYLNDNEQYPADVNRGLPSGIEQYLPEGDWPEGPWLGSVYDWDNWIIDEEKIYQVSLRTCDYNTDPENCEKWMIFPSFDKWSAIYYCIQGECRAHSAKPVDHPGFCINCDLNEDNYLWQ